ncbi:hypothetical protein [Symbiopectobacterium purcellii]
MRQRSIAGCYQNNVAWLYHLCKRGVKRFDDAYSRKSVSNLFLG